MAATIRKVPLRRASHTQRKELELHKDRLERQESYACGAQETVGKVLFAEEDINRQKQSSNRTNWDTSAYKAM